MFKTNDQRLRQALAAIELHAGRAEAEYIDEELSRGLRLRYAHLLEMGGYEGKSGNTQEKGQRNAVRGLLLTGLVLGRVRDIDVTSGVKQELMQTPLPEIVRRMKAAFPYRAFSGRYSNLDSWAPDNFTSPVAGLMTNYRFIVHGIMADMSKVAQKGFNAGVTEMEWDALLERYDESLRQIKSVGKGQQQSQQLWVNFARQYLQNPAILRYNIISASVISDAKHASYYPIGFILKVPQENVYSTSSKDQAVKNRAEDTIKELQRVYDQVSGGRIQTPDEILNGTTGASGHTGYNEIVLVGTSPEGKEVKAVGVFVKVAANGNLYVRQGQTEPYVTTELLKLVKNSGLPLVKVVDTSGAAATVPVG
ncbi:MAG TPA: hypothetical protein VGN52_13120 [Burkholderiales bacterium]|jgi:hypothetical protein